MNRISLFGAVVCAVALILSSSVTPAVGQATGRLFGSVVDASGSAVPGATVTLMLEGGDTPLLSVVTSAEGFFNFSAVRPEFYDLTIEATGFSRRVVRRVKVDPARETEVAAVRLEVAGVSAEVAVVASPIGVQTSSVEVSSTITNEQIRRLPLINRSPLALIETQAGVTDGRGDTVINGLRTSFANVTLDGINIQDNMLRGNALDFSPNMLLLDQVAEISITTSNANATVSGGAAHVAFVTPSGSNQYHGSAYWTNRNSLFAANDWFDNRDGIAKPFLNQNQVGASLGGPIKRDKLLFYGNYEAFRLREQTSVNRTIPTADARQGIYTYRDSGGVVRRVNILQAMGLSIDPATQQLLSNVPGSDKINNFRTGDSSEALLRNTAGHSFVQRDNRTRDNATAKIDYHPSTRHSFSGSYVWNRDIIDRGDVNSTGYTVVPKVFNDDVANLLSIGWRWNPSPTFTNEVRGGFNLAPALFATTETFPERIISPPSTIVSNPLNTFRGQGRDTNTYNFMDNASFWSGKHNLQFGFQHQRIRTAPFNDAGITPTYTLGIGSGNQGLTAAQLPGIAASDLTAANNLLATLAGYVTSYTQTFNIKDRNSGFVGGQTNRRHFKFDQYSLYLQDSWKALPRLTATLGVRYEYFTVLDERDGLFLLPQIQNNDPVGTLLSPNSVLDFAGSAVGKPWYNKDKNNFAPNIGLAWDVFGNGKLALRAGYSISFVNDEHVASIRNNVQTSSGLSAISSRSGLSGRITTGLPAVTVPAYKVPRTFAENYALDPQSAFGLPDPNLRTPYVQEWHFGIQQNIRGTIVDLRYLGNHATKAFRAFDYNQVVIRENGFLEDFNRALSNGNLARARAGVFDPAFNASVPGSQQLPVFARLSSGGLLTNSTIRSLIETGQAGDLAATYQINGLNGQVNFFRNPFALGTNIITNFSNTTYNAFQVDVTRRLSGDLQFQANYSFSKVLSDAIGTSEARFEALLDNDNPRLERARPTFDLTHAFKANGVYQLPIGEGHWFNMPDSGMRHFLTGWSASGILVWQSGVPFSILSGRGTVNRAARSTSTNTAVSTLTNEQLRDVVSFRMSSTGPYIVAASAIGSDGRGVAPDGSAPFNGQVFSHPGPGTNGNLQRRMFNGPSLFTMDFALMKTTRFKENQSVEFRMEAANIFNHPSFTVGDHTISSTNFGKITSTFYGRRVIQFGLQYRF